MLHHGVILKRQKEQNEKQKEQWDEDQGISAIRKQNDYLHKKAQADFDHVFSTIINDLKKDRLNNIYHVGYLDYNTFYVKNYNPMIFCNRYKDFIDSKLNQQLIRGYNLKFDDSCDSIFVILEIPKIE